VYPLGKFAIIRNAEQSTRWFRMRRIRKCLLSKPFALVVVLALLWTNNVEFFLFVLHHRRTLYIRSLTVWSNRKLCDKCTKISKCSTSVRTEEFVDTVREALITSPWKSMQRLAQQIRLSVSTACKNLSWWLIVVTLHNAMISHCRKID
jgi:hypothetical protein